MRVEVHLGVHVYGCTTGDDKGVPSQPSSIPSSQIRRGTTTSVDKSCKTNHSAAGSGEVA